MPHDDADRERQRLRQLAETAGSLAPREMRRAVERDTPPEPRPWSATGRPERVAALMIVVVLVASVAVVGALMAARGYGLFVAIFVAALVVVFVYAEMARRRRWRDHR